VQADAAFVAGFVALVAANRTVKLELTRLGVQSVTGSQDGVALPFMALRQLAFFPKADGTPKQPVDAWARSSDRGGCERSRRSLAGPSEDRQNSQFLNEYFEVSVSFSLPHLP